MHRLKRFTMAVFMAVRRVLVPAMLFCVYFLVLGPLALLVRLFGLLPEVERGAATYWRKARSGAADTEEAAGQS